MTEIREDAWLRITDVSGTIIFDCVHQIKEGYNWDWSAGADSGTVGTVQELFQIAGRVLDTHPASVADGYFVHEFIETHRVD